MTEQKMFVIPEDRYIEHYGVKGMHWGVRKDGKPQGFQYGEAGRRSLLNRATKVTAATLATGAGVAGPIIPATVASKAYKELKSNTSSERIPIDRYSSKEDALRARDLDYIQRYQDQFSTQEINNVINRINAENNLAKINRQMNPTTKDKVQKILKNPVVKTAVVGAAATGGLLLISEHKGYKEAVKEAAKTGGPSPSFSDIFKNTAKNFPDQYMQNMTGIVTSKLNKAATGKKK